MKISIVGAACALAIGLLWLFVLPQVRDELNLMTIILVVSALSVSLAHLAGDGDYKRKLFLLAFPPLLLFALALVTSVSRLPGLSTVREVFLVAAVFSAGMIYSRLAGLEWTLFGILVGASLSAGMSWFLALDDFSSVNDYFMTAITSGGVSSNRAIEYASALMGVVAGLALLLGKRFPRPVVAPATVALLATIVFSFSLTAQISLIAISLASVVLSLRLHRRLRVLTGLGLGLSAAGFVLIVLAIPFRLEAVQLASLLGRTQSLEARILSWESILRALDFPGVLVGYGATFWLEDTSSAIEANRPLEAFNYGPFDISHSIYLDGLVAFGLVGLALIAHIVLSIIRKAESHKSQPLQQIYYFAAWLFVVAIAVSGLTDSFVAYRPSGWLLLGLLYGALYPWHAGKTLRDWFQKPIGRVLRKLQSKTRHL